MTEREQELLDMLKQVTVAYRDVALWAIRHDLSVGYTFPELKGLGAKAKALIRKYEPEALP